MLTFFSLFHHPKTKPENSTDGTLITLWSLLLLLNLKPVPEFEGILSGIHLYYDPPASGDIISEEMLIYTMC